jgi:hypothetical protein
MAEWSSWLAWLGLTQEQLDVVAKVFGSPTPFAQVAGGAGGSGQGNFQAGAESTVGTSVIQPKYGIQPYSGAPPMPQMKYGILPVADKPPNIQTLYAVPIPSSPPGVRVYLTDRQKLDLLTQGVAPCDFVEITPPMMKYGISIPVEGPPPTTKYGIHPR